MTTKETVYKFEYSEHMKEYRRKNDVRNSIVFVKILNKNQLKNKYPKFIIKTTSEYGNHECTYRTEKLPDGTFRVSEGYGQMASGIISAL